jgi:gluconate kinase
MSGAMVLTGAPGAGKTSVLDALCTRLEIDDIRFGAIETEHLARGWPWLTARQWTTHLADLIASQRQAGRDTFLVVATTETEAELRGVIEALGDTKVVVICLSAPPHVAARRVDEREPDSWPGKPALIEHARKLAHDIPRLPSIDAVLSTVERPVAEVAAEVSEILLARGVIRPGP